MTPLVVLLLSRPVVVAFAVFFAVIAFTVVWAAFWYHFRQEKQVRSDDDGQEELFRMRPGEEDMDDDRELDDPDWVRHD